MPNNDSFEPFDNQELMSIQNELIVEKMTLSIKKSLDEIVIQGLKNHGYTFNDIDSLIEFIKKNCQLRETIDSNDKIYYVKEKPFLLYRKSYELEFNKESMVASVGSYRYIYPDDKS